MYSKNQFLSFEHHTQHYHIVIISKLGVLLTSGAYAPRANSSRAECNYRKVNRDGDASKRVRQLVGLAFGVDEGAMTRGLTRRPLGAGTRSTVKNILTASRLTSCVGDGDTVRRTPGPFPSKYSPADGCITLHALLPIDVATFALLVRDQSAI